jgi:hypothetical protein
MSVSCYYSGRHGNCIFAAANVIAYAKKHGNTFFLPTEANAYKGFTGDNKVPFYIPPTGSKPIRPTIYQEPNMAHGTPYYHEIPKMDNVSMDGYFQSFLFFDWCRDYILETFGFPYKMEEGVVSVSVRRGDCVNNQIAFPMCPKEYYHNAIEHMQRLGYSRFRVDSDDRAWVRNEFTSDEYNGADFIFSEFEDPLESWLAIQNCTHNIIARSTWSLTAAWFNKNPDKIVLVPTLRHTWWKGVNLDILSGTEFTQIDFDDPTNTLPPIPQFQLQAT